MKKILLLMLFFFSVTTSNAEDGTSLAVSSTRAEDGTVLATAFQLEVKPALDVPEPDQARYAALLESALASAAIPLFKSQYVVLVDSNPHVQAVFIYWLDSQVSSKVMTSADFKSSSDRFRFIRASPVSSGKPGRFDYFTTPLGVFAHTLDNKDFRVEGTLNSLGIRGLGDKGMRVFDFGWAEGVRGWGKGGTSQMRLLIHATDPDYLEKYLGVARSKGCIRIPETLNIFIDRYGILDADYELALANGEKLWMLRPDRMPTLWSGRYLVIIDSDSTERPAWSPAPEARQSAPGEISRPKAIH